MSWLGRNCPSLSIVDFLSLRFGKATRPAAPALTRSPSSSSAGNTLVESTDEPLTNCCKHAKKIDEMCHLANATGPAAGREILPATVKPTHYAVNITPDLETFKFKGTVDISLKINETIKTIVCNANELEISAASITVVHMKTESKQTATNITLDKKAETATFEFANAIEAGSTATLHVEYTGLHNDKMAGFYRSTYTGKDGEKKFMVVTQFEATDCRRALPSWDEPNLKATFDVTLNVSKDLTALSNMNCVSETDVTVDSKSLKAVTFATTPVMSTYLLAFAVGDLEYIETKANPKQPSDAKPLTVRVYTLKGQKEQGQFALEVCARTLEFFSEYFDIAYPLPKMDLIAIPDFSAGAMENWGLVTYREVYLLYDEKSSSAKAKQQIAYVVGHELAHQWFGNLVTMDWWSELWLNEGFATFVGWLAVDNLFPEWKVWTQFLNDEHARGKELDGLRSSHPIDVDVKSPAEITQIFDAISYCKGASVIRMLNAFLGTETFKNGTRAYLKEHQFSNATTLDLWKALSAASGQDVASFMHPWTRDVGYPVVTVEKEEFNAEKGELTIHLKQNRYLASGDVTPEEDSKSLWWVPLGITTHLNAREPTQHILSEKTAKVSFPYKEGEGAFWKLNYQTNGFYRVRLSEEQLKKLGAVIKKNPEALTTEDRIGVIADAFNLAVAGYGSTSGALELLRNFEAEEDYIVLSELAARLKSIISAWYQEDPAVTEGLKAVMRNIFSRKVETLGYEYPEKEDHLTALKRTLVIECAAGASDEKVVKELQNRFHKFAAGDEKALPPNLRSIAYRTALKSSTSPTEDFEAVLKIYKTAPTADQRLSALYALGAINDPALVDRLINQIVLDKDLVRPNEAPYPLRSVSKETLDPKHVRPLLWQFSVKNWKVLYERYAPSLSLLAAMLTLGFADQVGTSVTDEVEAWLRGDDLSSQEEKDKRKEELKLVNMPVSQALEKVKGTTKWVERERGPVAAWLKKSGFAA
ncbi:peptidase family M1-domain-containing protein [Phlyctochytrium arcticum]|nr:peptidase family M1-domain-containing protein [Phlyctochytrium arcticum]